MAATFTGALLGLAVEIRANLYRNHPTGPGCHAFMMGIGAVYANLIVDWDNEARDERRRTAAEARDQIPQDRAQNSAQISKDGAGIRVPENWV